MEWLDGPSHGELCVQILERKKSESSLVSVKARYGKKKQQLAPSNQQLATTSTFGQKQSALIY